MSEFRLSQTRAPLAGVLRAPADKSISHRAAILSALAEGHTRIENWLPSITTQATVQCLNALGVTTDQPDPRTLVVRGLGLRSMQEPDERLFCAGSGTTMRLLAGVCAGQPTFSILDGTPALRRRPMARVVKPLQEMGATVLARDGGRLPPLAISGGNLHGIRTSLAIASAQVKSAILLAGLNADSPTTVKEPSPSRDHTERMLRAFGAQVQESAVGVTVYPPTDLASPAALCIPGDFSSAAFFIVAALLVPGSEVCLERVGVNPTRTGLLDVLLKMGAEVRVEHEKQEAGEPIADLVVRAGQDLNATEIGGSLVPRMIDEAPILAVAATQANGETVIRDAEELRVKESDRIATLAQELRRMGAQVKERADGFAVLGPTPLSGARVSSHGDHRLAMSLAVAALIARGDTVIEGWECVADSFPDFGDLLSQAVKPRTH